jgi:GH24 family phage-related lysozyme (muramidase)
MAEYNVSKDVKDLVKQLEGFSATAYPDAKGHSIGFGHFIKPGEEHLLGMKISSEEAEKYLEEDIKSHQKSWIGGLKEGTPSGVVSALTSLAYNVGPNSPGLIKAVAAVNAGDTAGASRIISEYNKSYDPKVGAKVTNQALVERRALEGKLLRGEKVDVKEFRSSSSGIVDRVKNFFGKPTSPNFSTSASDGPATSNAIILQGLKEVNMSLKTASDERSYLDRLRMEGSGLWAAQ